MSGTDDKPMSGEPPQTAELVKPKAAHWLWRPWYAKSWWTAAATFWLIAFFAPYLSLNADRITPIVLLFHPFLIVPVLGFGFFRAWIRYHFLIEAGWINTQGSIDRFGADGDLLRRMDPTNPADSRYYWHPGNPGSEAWRNEHVRGLR